MTKDIPRKADATLAHGLGLAGKITVLVDGADVTDICTGYDCDAGEATIHVIGKSGRPLLARHGDERTILTGSVRGTVEVRRK